MQSDSLSYPMRRIGLALPRVPVHFYGRQNDLSHIVRLCVKETSASIAVLGSGGIGELAFDSPGQI